MVALVLGVGSIIVLAQDADKPPQRDGPPREGRPGAGGEGRGMARMPLMMALDANSDGVLDKAEIANASAALKKLDKNNDGQITLEEYRPTGQPGRPGGLGIQGGAGGGTRPERPPGDKP